MKRNKSKDNVLMESENNTSLKINNELSLLDTQTKSESNLELINSPTSSILRKQFDTEVDFIYEIKSKAKNLQNPNRDKLQLLNSKDDILVDKLNNDESKKEIINEFNDMPYQMLSGSKESKRICIEMIDKIKDNESRSTEEGEVMFNKFIEFKSKMNINYLDANKSIDFDESVIKNTVYYLMIGVEDITSLSEFSDQINMLISSSSMSIPQQITNTDEVNANIDDINKKIEISEKNNNDKIDTIANSNKSYAWKIVKGLVTMFIAKPLMTSTLGLGSMYFIVKIVGDTASKIEFSSPVNIPTTSLSTPSTPALSRRNSLPATVTEAIIRYIHSLTKKDD